MSDSKWDSLLVTINRSLGKNTQTKNNNVNEKLDWLEPKIQLIKDYKAALLPRAVNNTDTQFNNDKLTLFVKWLTHSTPAFKENGFSPQLLQRWQKYNTFLLIQRADDVSNRTTEKRETKITESPQETKN